jgi:predicted nicotinamide N-methyase
VLAGDVLYDEALAARMLPYLQRAADRGVQVLVGDPDRGHLPPDRLELVAAYPVPVTEPSVDSPVRRVQVLRPR